MKTKAVRLYGEMDLRLDEFELPEMQDDEMIVPQNSCPKMIGFSLISSGTFLCFCAWVIAL